MQTLGISLPDSLEVFVQQQVVEKKMTDVNEYFQKLVYTEQQEHQYRELEQFVREGLESGEGEPVSPEYWQRIRREVQKRLNQKGVKIA